MTSLAYAALWLYVFSVPWGGAVAINSGVNLVSRVTGMVAVGLAMLSAVMTARLRRWHPFHLAALLFVMWSGVTQLLKITMGDRLSSKFWTFVQLFLVLWIIWELAPSKRRQLGLLTAYLFGSYVLALDTLRLSRGQGELMRRFASGGADPNTIAMTLALALPIAWYLGSAYHQPVLRWISRAYLPIGLLALGLTGSRGGMLAGMVALLTVPLTMTKLTPTRLATAIALLVLSGALAVAYVPDRIVERLATTGTEVEDLSLGGRFTIWRAGILAFVRKPIMGYGTGGFRGAVAPWGVDHVAHNSFLSVLVEQGLIGFLLYMTMFFAVFVAVLRLPHLERRFALILLATLGVAMLPLTWEDNKVVWFILAALIGVARAPAAAADGRSRPMLPLETGPDPRRSPGLRRAPVVSASSGGPRSGL
jgi:O-antigen ligase